jgi:hypothetical protein
MSTSIIPISSSLHQTLKDLAKTSRMIFITGLPGVGKSLLIQQLGLIANELGREVHLLQWISARKAFETEENLAKYPEVEGVTAPAIRKAVGLWARDAVWRWHQTHPGREPLLVGELPLIGNRLIELAQPQDDDVEGLLSGEATQFVVPVPSWEVRQVIESARAESLAHPRHEQETRDAAPNVLRALWQEVNGVAREIRLTKASPNTTYNPYIYGGVYQALLAHRRVETILIDEVLQPAKSVYELDVVASELGANPKEISHYMGLVEKDTTPEELEATVANWHASITADPKPVDPGPELRLPPPEKLPGVAARTVLTPEQRDALQQILALPLGTPPSQTIPVLESALSVLTPVKRPDPVSAKQRKFDVFDSYFNVSRDAEESGITFLSGLLLAYRNVLENMSVPPQTLSVVEAPMLRIALETAIRQFEL